MNERSQTPSFSPDPEAYARVSRLTEALEDESRSGLRALVVGAGRSGQAAVQLLLAHGATVKVADDRADALAGLGSEFASVNVIPLSEEACTTAELVVLSPGVPRTRPELAPAIVAGTLVAEVELASWFLHIPMVGITGTNGKSTTTMLVAHMLQQKYPGKVFAGGNIGTAMCRLALDPDQAIVAAVELSSYQLESIVQTKFHVCCWLNLTPDHTDRYQDIHHYGAAKARLLERRAVNGCAVLNAKDPWCARAGLSLGGAVRWFAATPTSDLAESMGTVLAEPELAVRVEGSLVESYRLDNPALIGIHNKSNALAAIESARSMGVSPDEVQAGLATFTGLAHRLEMVREHRGVQWRNDSKATNIDSAVTGIQALDRPILLIAGGRDKGASWQDLVDAAAGRVTRVFAIGEAASLVVGAFRDSELIVEDVGTLAQAVLRAEQEAVSGDVVLLSPACSSFDQFPDFEVRGDTFKALVMALGDHA